MAPPIQFPEVLLQKTEIFFDDRGFFTEVCRKEEMGQYVQINHSFSKKGVIRGMHFQSHPGQAKKIRCIEGEIFDVFVDIRHGSKTFGKWGYYLLKGQKEEEIIIPVGFAHGFAVLSEKAHLLYQVSSYYAAETEKGFCYNDPEVGIEWPVEHPILSEKDRRAGSLKEVCQVEIVDTRR